MKKLLFVVVLCAAGWTAFTRYQQAHGNRGESREAEPALLAASALMAPAARPTASEPAPNSRFSCDGRTYCSQMTSCEEATYFLRHCPNTKMDGDHDGIPCERQWCNDP